MKLATHHWLATLLVSIGLHIGLAVAFASFVPTPDPGSVAAGIGGVTVGLGRAGSSYRPPLIAQKKAIEPAVVEPQPKPAPKPSAKPTPKPSPTPKVKPKPEPKPKPKSKAKAKPKAKAKAKAKIKPLVTPKSRGKPEADASRPSNKTRLAIAPPLLPVTVPPTPVMPEPEAAPVTETPKRASTPAPLKTTEAKHPLPDGSNKAIPSTSANTSPATASLPATGEGKQQSMGGIKGDSSLYFSKLMAELNRHKRYPVLSKRRKEEGVVMVALAIARDGSILFTRIRNSSGHESLDKAAVELVNDASPLPSVPDSLTQVPLEVVIPIEYSLITNSH